MKTLTIAGVLVGAFLIESAVSNRNPLTFAQALIQQPRAAGSIAQNTKGTGFVSTQTLTTGTGPTAQNIGTPQIAGFSTGGNIVALGKYLQSLGFHVAEHPAFGGVAPVHMVNSQHYVGQAIDVNWPDKNEEPAKIDAIYPALKATGEWRLLWRAPGHYDHLHIGVENRRPQDRPKGLTG